MHLFIQMKPKPNSSRIGRRADKQGSRPPEGNQSGVEKSASGIQSSQNDPPGLQNQVLPNPDPVVIDKPSDKPKRMKWTIEDYQNVLRAFYTAQSKPKKSSLTQQTFDEWKKLVGNSYRTYLDPKKLANVRRDIFKKKRLNDAQIEYIRRESVVSVENNHERSENQEPVVNVRNLSESEIEKMIDQVRNPGQYVEDEHEERELFGEEILDALFVQENEGKISAARDDIIRFYSQENDSDLHHRETLPKLPFTAKSSKVVKIYNFALKRIFEDDSDASYDMLTLNDLIYATAKAATENIGLKVKKTTPKHKNKLPKWKQKLQKEIETLRAEISILDEISRGTVVKTKKAKRIKSKHKIVDKASLDSAKEKVKQVMQLKAQRLRRFDKRSKFYRQNKVFQMDAKKFYREIGKGSISVDNPPDVNEMQGFWNNIWGEEKSYNKEAAWIDREEDRMNGLEEQEWEDVTVEEVRAALGKTQKWKSPGVDKIPNFWLNSLSHIHIPLTNCINHILSNPNDVPDWITEGVTYLLPKSEDTHNPKNFRPITCLTTIYKLMTSILTERMYIFLSTNNILPNEQKGCKRNSYGCKDQLLIDRMILENCRTRSKNLSTAWIDYRKAFDSVPHDWILKTLDLYKVSPVISNFLRGSMGGWKTKLVLSHNNGVIKSDFLDIKRGIFQGDSLSPLLFCLALVPLSNELNNTGCGYKIFDNTISHLFYMDDLKLFAKNDVDLEGLLTTVKQFSEDICMEFGLDKCAKASFVRGRIHKKSSIVLDTETTIKELDPEASYKYLGVNEGDGINHSAMKEKIRKEYYRRVRMVLKTELNSKNRIQAINSLAIPVVQYSFNIINWNVSDLQRMDRKTRKLLTCHRMLHPKSDVDRLYLPRGKGGRGLLQVELAYRTATIGMKTYLEHSEDWMMQVVLRHETMKTGHSIVKEAQKFQSKLDIDFNDRQRDDIPATKVAKSLKQKVKLAEHKKLEQRWSQKPLHGQFFLRSQQADVDQEATHQWLKSSGLKAETEGFILAAQDQSLMTRNYQANILKNGADQRCRFCNNHVETIDHLVSGCPTLTPNEYVKRHDRVGQYLHWCICNHYGIELEAAHWYEHHPPAVVEQGNVTVLWDFPINTDRTIKANRPDIVVKDRLEKTCLLIDMSVPSDRNIAVKEFDKLSKYKDLEIEIQKMWHLKTTIVPVIVGALGVVKKSMQEHIDKIPGQPLLQEIQKIVLTSTSHILRKTLSL